MTGICYTSVAQGRFLAESGRRAVTQVCPAVPKMPWAQSASPIRGASGAMQYT